MSKEVKRYSPDTNGRMREWPEGDYATWDDYDELAAENDRLRTKNDRMARERSARQALSIQLIDEARGLRAERDSARMRVRELDLLFGRYLLAMKAAVIDADQRGDEEGMRWIYNSLAGPGELPAEDEIDAQAFFDREIKPINDGMAEVMAYHRAALQGEQP